MRSTSIGNVSAQCISASRLSCAFLHPQNFILFNFLLNIQDTGFTFLVISRCFGLSGRTLTRLKPREKALKLLVPCSSRTNATKNASHADFLSSVDASRHPRARYEQTASSQFV